MGHGITETDAIFSVREMPWHGLGVILDEHPTRDEAQKLVHPWEPIEAPVYRRVPEITLEGELSERFEQIPGEKLIERSDNGHPLGVVKDSRGLITNSELWDVAEAIGEIGRDVEIETGGSLEGGNKVWALLRFAEPINITGDPNGATIPFFALQNHHAKPGSFRGQGINTRIVCANTSAAADLEAKASGYEFNFKHSSKVGERIEEAKAAVALWREGVRVWQNAMENLVSVRVSDAQVREFVELFQPMPPERLISDRVRNNVESARGQVWEILNGPTSEGVRNTAYGLFQAGVEWAGHARGLKGYGETEAQLKRTRMESYFKRNMLSNDSLRHATLELVKDVAGVGA